MTSIDNKSWLIQTDLSQVMDHDAMVYGYDNERAIPQELVAEQRLDEAEYNYHDWRMGSLYPEVKEMVSKQVEVVVDGGKHNTAAIEAEAERRTYFSKKYYLEGRISGAQQRLEETRTALDYDMVPIDEPIEHDTRTPYQAWKEQFMAGADQLSDDDLIKILENIGDNVIRTTIESILIERHTSLYHRLSKRILGLANREKNTEQQYKSWCIAMRHNVADEYFSISDRARELFRLISLKKQIHADLWKEKDRMDASNRKAELKKTKELLELDPDKVIDVQPGQKYWFETEDGYLPGSCTEVKYVRADGEVFYNPDGMDIPIYDPEEDK